MLDCIIRYVNGKTKIVPMTMSRNDRVAKGVLNELADYKKVETVDVCICDDVIKAGDEGFYVLPGGGWSGKFVEAAKCSYKELDDIDYTRFYPHMYMMGINHNNRAYVAIVTGMKEISHPRVVVCDNEYKFYIRFSVDCEKPYEEFSIELHELVGDLSYSAMGREYRKHQLANGFVSIKDRLNDSLKYAVESVNIRVRHGWKPVPCSIMHQTRNNEPPVHTACTFRQVEDLMHEYKAAGIEKAEFCLVGWNVGGHDGRWLEILPPEGKFGGEPGLRSLIKTADELGYVVSCHTNSTDGYTIANNFTDDDIALNKYNDRSIEAEVWGGGRTYNVCPKRGYEISKQTLPEVAELGFRGTHYIDVITATPPRFCYNKNHPVNRKEACEYYDKLFEFTRDLFGCVGSECAFDHSMKNCDYVLYASFRNGLTSKATEEDYCIVDEYIPLWQIAYHGIVLSNPYAVTVNAVRNKDKRALLKVIEMGGRPSIYYYARFRSDTKDWIGEKDFVLDTPQDVKECVDDTKTTVDIYNELSYLQYEFMESHEEIEPDVYKVVYSDGSEIVVDYNKETYTLKKAGNK